MWRLPQRDGDTVNYKNMVKSDIIINTYTKENLRTLFEKCGNSKKVFGSALYTAIVRDFGKQKAALFVGSFWGRRSIVVNSILSKI